MPHPEMCPGCQRAVIDVRTPVRACEDATNGTPQRCAWRSLRQQVAMTSAPWPDEAPFAAKPAPAAHAAQAVPAASADAVTSGARVARPTERPATSPASSTAPSASMPPSTSAPAPAAASPSASTAPTDPLAAARQQLEDEKAAKRSLREQLRMAEAVAAEAQAIRAGLFDELERTRAELARARSEPATAEAGAALANDASVPAAAAASTGASGPVLVDPLSLTAAPWPPSRAGREKKAAREAETAGASPDDRPARPPAPRRSSLVPGLLALGAVAGVALGAAGVSWLRTSNEPAIAMQMDETPPASQPQSPSPSQSGAPSSGGATTAHASEPPPPLAAAEPVSSHGSAEVAAAAPSSSSAADLRARVQAALATEGVVGAVEVADGGGAVSVVDPTADREARARTDMIIRSVYAGAQLPAPTIEHRGAVPVRADRVAGMHRRHAGEDPIMAAANGHRGDDLMTYGTPAAGRRAAPAAQEASPGAPVESRTVVLPVGRITSSCDARVAHASLLRKSWVMWGCMRESCCATGAAERSEECQAYSHSYPLSCPSR